VTFFVATVWVFSGVALTTVSAQVPCTIETFAGGGVKPAPNDGSLAREVLLSRPFDIATDSAGNVFFTDTAADEIRVVRASTGIIETVYGRNAPVGERLRDPRGLAMDSQGNLYVADRQRNQILRIQQNGTMSVIAGRYGFMVCGSVFTCGDKLPALDAVIPEPFDIAVDSSGNVYVADNSFRGDRPGEDVYPKGIRKINAADGRIDSVRGVDGRRINLDSPQAIAIDSQDWLVAATLKGVFRINLAGEVEEFPDAAGFLSQVSGIAAGQDGNIYLSQIPRAAVGFPDRSDHVAVLTPKGSLRTIVGLANTRETVGDGGPAPSASVVFPRGIIVDSRGDLLIADSLSGRVRRVFAPQDCPSEKLPLMKFEGFTNGASFSSAAASPGMVFSIFGVRLGSPTLRQSSFGPDGRLPRELAGTQVFINGVAAPLLFSLDTQVGGIVPFGVPTEGTITVEVAYEGIKSEPLPAFGYPSHAGVFTLDATGRGQAAALNQDGTINSPLRPARRGEWMVLYATGLGKTDPPSVDGTVNETPWGVPLQSVKVFLNSQEVDVLFVGSAPGLIAGVFQLNVRIPADFPFSGIQPVTLRVGDFSINPAATVAID